MSQKNTIVSIVGRQNVGKSTLFNALIKEKKAIVDSSPGLTRDILSTQVNHAERIFTLSDTPGLDLNDSSALSQAILSGARKYLQQSEVIILLLENPSPSPFDLDLNDFIRKLSIPTIIAVNKMDNTSDMENMINFYEMGFNDLLPISALGRINLNLLFDKIINFLPSTKSKISEPDLNISIIGRPNSGKSTLLNAFIGYDRALVSDIPGTTRDAVDEEFNFYGSRIRVIDTAGIRKKSKVKKKIDYYSLLRSLDALKKSDVTFHLIDSTMGITDTDKKISDEIQKAKKPAIIAINKWDMIQKDNKTFEQYKDKIIFKFYKAADYPIISISAKDKVRIHRLINIARELKEKSKTNVGTALLNKMLHDIQKNKRPPQLGEKLKVFYTTQTGINPPTFKLFVNDPALFKKDIIRFFEKYIKRTFNFEGIPIILQIEGRKKK